MQQTIQIGRVVLPSVLQQLAASVKNCRARLDRAIEKSDFCRIVGFTPWHFSLQGMAYTAFVGLVIFVVCGFAGWLCQKGGAL